MSDNKKGSSYKRIKDSGVIPEEYIEKFSENLDKYEEQLKKEKKANLNAFHLAIKDMDINDLDAIFGCYIR